MLHAKQHPQQHSAQNHTPSASPRATLAHSSSSRRASCQPSSTITKRAGVPPSCAAEACQNRDEKGVVRTHRRYA
eukprot:1537927-Rhodomonas_salina.3